MPEKQTKNTVIRSKKICFLRYFLRRKRCSYILWAEIGLTVAFLLLSISFYILKKDMYKIRLVKEREDLAIKKYHNRTTFAHCKYRKVENDTIFKTNFCEDRAGLIAFAYRYREFEASNDNKTSSCINLNEQIMCHDDLIQKRNKTSSFSINLRNDLNLFMPPQDSIFCYGRSMPSSVKSVKYTPWQDGKGGERHAILKDLSNYLNSTLHASELHYKCPICSIPADQRKECIRRLETKNDGWPWFLKRCNNVEKSEVNCAAKNHTHFG